MASKGSPVVLLSGIPVLSAHAEHGNRSAVPHNQTPLCYILQIPASLVASQTLSAPTPQICPQVCSFLPAHNTITALH